MTGELTSFPKVFQSYRDDEEGIEKLCKLEPRFRMKKPPPKAGSNSGLFDQ